MPKLDLVSFQVKGDAKEGNEAKQKVVTEGNVDASERKRATPCNGEAAEATADTDGAPRSESDQKRTKVE